MNPGDYQYRLNKLHRDDVIRAARREHLVRQAQETRPKTRQAYVAALMSLLQSIAR